MRETFNAVEVFKIAEQIERDGAAFYRNAAGKFDASDVAGLFGKLADWELTHERTFAGMRQAIQARSLITVSDAEKCRAMAALSEFTIRNGRPDDLAKVTGIESVLELALEFERDSITFYEGLKGFVTDPAAVEKIDRIIAEEHVHIEMLRAKLP